MGRYAYYILVPLGCVLGLLVAAIVIQQGADIIAGIVEHIMELFETANFRAGDGLGNTIELLLIAAFVGWAINRFKRK